MERKTTNSNQELASARQMLVRSVLQWAPEQGLQDTALEGVGLVRSDAPTHFMPTVYEPSLIFVVQGRKTVQLGDEGITYDPLSYLAASVYLPVMGQIVDASPEQPYLAIRLTIESREVTDLVLELGGKAPAMDAYPDLSCALSFAWMDQGLLDGVIRLLALLQAPADAPILAPLVRREIVYRALMGEIGPRMRAFARVGSQANRISRAIAVLKDRFLEPLRISDLAEQVNMSESSLYHSFKQVTRMSPLQFQKKLRLHEARRLMLSEGLEAATASYRVGYESPSHFSREYRRLFGAPPRADVNKLRGEQTVTA
jgi:AraC-like DNA-binding protein